MNIRDDLKQSDAVKAKSDLKFERANVDLKKVAIESKKSVAMFSKIARQIKRNSAERLEVTDPRNKKIDNNFDARKLAKNIKKQLQSKSSTKVMNSVRFTRERAARLLADN